MYNAHNIAYPQYDWKEFGNRFVSGKLGLEREQYTTQISNYDCLGKAIASFPMTNSLCIVSADVAATYYRHITQSYYNVQ